MDHDSAHQAAHDAAHHAALQIHADHHIHHSSSLHSNSVSRHHYGPTHYSGQRRRSLIAPVVVGIVLLMISVGLIIAGIVFFVSPSGGSTFNIGIPLLIFGGVMFLAGVSFTCIGCCNLKAARLNQGQQTTREGVTHTPHEQIPNNAGFNQPPNNNAGFGQSQNNVGYGQPQNNVGFSQPQNNVGFGQPYNTVGFGQPLNNVGFGQPCNTVGFGQPLNNVGFGQ